MPTNPSTVLYLLYSVLFFDLILLVSLSYYYTKLGYPYLKFGAAAMAVEMFSLASYFLGVLIGTYQFPFVLGGIGKIVFAALLLTCIAHLVKRKVPVQLMLVAIIFFIGNQVHQHLAQLNLISFHYRQIP